MPLTSEQFEQLTRFLTCPPRHRGAPAFDGPERRETARPQARGPAELHFPAQAPMPGAGVRGRCVGVYIHDVSAGGMGLMSGSQARPDTTVDLVVSNGCDDVTLRCTVRHCTVLAVGLWGIGLDVVTFRVKEAEPDCPAAEAAAAWAGLFTNQRTTTQLAVAG